MLFSTISLCFSYTRSRQDSIHILIMFFPKPFHLTLFFSVFLRASHLHAKIMSVDVLCLLSLHPDALAKPDLLKYKVSLQSCFGQIDQLLPPIELRLLLSSERNRRISRYEKLIFYFFLHSFR